MSLATSISSVCPKTAWLRSSSSSYLQIRAAKHLRAAAAATPATEDVAEHLAEHLAEGIAARESAAPATLARGIDARMPMLVVDGALLASQRTS